MVARVKPSVVRIAWGRSSGSGVIFQTYPVDNSAYVLTNHHVVEGASTVDVHVGSHSQYVGRTVWTDPEKDLAVVTFCCSSSLVTAPFTPRTPNEGADLVAMGYPLGVDSPVVTKGVLSAVHFDSDSDSWLIQTDAPLNPGSSGGPLLNASGEVVGITVGKVSHTNVEGTGFAVAGRTILRALPHLRELVAYTAAITPTPTPRPTLRPTATPTPTPPPPTPEPALTLSRLLYLLSNPDEIDPLWAIYSESELPALEWWSWEYPSCESDRDECLPDYPQGVLAWVSTAESSPVNYVIMENPPTRILVTEPADYESYPVNDFYFRQVILLQALEIPNAEASDIILSLIEDIDVSSDPFRSHYASNASYENLSISYHLFLLDNDEKAYTLDIRIN